MTTYSITEFKATLLNRSFLSNKPEQAHVATVEVEGEVLGLSRYADEAYWVVDSHFKANGMPVRCHGAGERTTMLQTLTPDHGLVGDLDTLRNEHTHG